MSLPFACFPQIDSYFSSDITFLNPYYYSLAIIAGFYMFGLKVMNE